jgi:hypothetical protein
MQLKCLLCGHVNVIRPSFYNSCKSYTNGYKYTSISFPGALDPRISKDNNIYGSFIHLHGSKLYGISTTGHMLYDVLILPNGLKPSLAKPSRTLRDSSANQECSLSNSFHAIESAGCLREFSSSTRPSLCHFMSLAISFDINNRCNLGFIGK